MKAIGWLVVMLMVCTVAGAPALAVAYEWCGGGDGTSWDSSSNWDPVGPCGGSTCYPSESGDEAIIGTNCSTCTIDLVDETIDEVYVLTNSLTFDDGDSSDPELAVSYFYAGIGLADEEGFSVIVKFTHGAKIVRSTSEP